MAVVTYLDNSIECTTALKGDDYIHLLDADGVMIAAFDGVTDFTGFSITDGEWTTPTAENDCYLAVVKDDGSIGKGAHRCCDITPIVSTTVDPGEGAAVDYPDGTVILVYE